MKRYKFITIDIEGDISSRICRDNFTEDTLYRDPNTITWLCSFYNGKDHKAMGIRLPHEPRKFRSPRKGTIESTVFGWHNPTNQFNYGITDYGTSENTAEYRTFLEAIAKVINYCYHHKIIVFFKGFKMNGKNDAYDREQIDRLMKKYGIECNTKCMIDINQMISNFYMAPTHAQKGQKTDNQTYMDNAILHNLEDSKNLWLEIDKKMEQKVPVIQK